MEISERERDALRKRDSRLANRVIQVSALPAEKLTVEQVKHEHSRIIDEYIDAKDVIRARRDKKLDALRERCSHENADEDSGSPWCNDCKEYLHHMLGQRKNTRDEAKS
ncbi:hypothetical protein LCGC14_2770780 [marine sediment metagenome]|uniref:Uncharacterized protein n=1 Tax=marine sediment metagenome TaxID=412755 RepID=A0A0F9B4Y4_9ZZZZ